MEGIQRIEALIGQIEALADPETRSTVRELVSAILEYHGEGFARVLEIVQDPVVIHALGRDEVAGSLLLLYGLHPEDFETRVRRAVDGIPHVRTDGHRATMWCGCVRWAPARCPARRSSRRSSRPLRRRQRWRSKGWRRLPFVPLESLIRAS